MVIDIRLSTERYGKSLARTASVKFVGRTLQKLLVKEEQRSIAHSDPTVNRTSGDFDSLAAGEERSTVRSHRTRMFFDCMICLLIDEKKQKLVVQGVKGDEKRANELKFQLWMNLPTSLMLSENHQSLVKTTISVKKIKSF